MASLHKFLFRKCSEPPKKALEDMLLMLLLAQVCYTDPCLPVSAHVVAIGVEGFATGNASGCIAKEPGEDDSQLSA